MNHRILIVEDEAIIRMALRKLLERHHYEVGEAGSVKEATGKHNLDNYDLIISDLRLPGEPGTELIGLAENTPVLIMTSYASLRSAVDAMRMGAVEYIPKPFDHDEMVATVERILLERAATSDSSNNEETDTFVPDNPAGDMLGKSAIMQTLYKRIEQIAPTTATVLVHGETGTGKELTAKAIHNASKRKDKPLISINCAAIPENLIESELFGHEKGAFTGATSSREGLIVAAEGGTLFLDEIGELPMEAQARLLRVLQEGEVRPVGSVDTRHVDVRLVAATHRDLLQRAKEGLFREDLYFRLNVIQLTIPPLRERGEDIVEIANAMVLRYCEHYGHKPLALADEAIAMIQHYQWPGNVRELENAMQRAVILSEGSETIGSELLSLDIMEDVTQTDTEETITGISSDSATLEPATTNGDRNSSDRNSEDLSLKEYFQRFVLEHQDSMSETELAKKLGVSRKCLWERRQKFGIPRKKMK